MTSDVNVMLEFNPTHAAHTQPPVGYIMPPFVQILVPHLVSRVSTSDDHFYELHATIDRFQYYMIALQN